MSDSILLEETRDWWEVKNALFRFECVSSNAARALAVAIKEHTDGIYFEPIFIIHHIAHKAVIE